MKQSVKERKRLLRHPAFPVAVLALIALILLVILVTHRESDPAPPPETLSGGALVVCIDPGHGGGDDGASWEGRLEKDDNLTMALALRDALEERGISAVLTREEDSTLSLEERVAAAEACGAGYFISLHRNSAEGGRGLEIWVARQCSAAAEDLAFRVEEALTGVGVQSDRGIRRGTQSGEGDYYVLHHTTMPAILVELGFLQDGEDNRLLDTYLKDYAAAMAGAILAAWEEASLEG